MKKKLLALTLALVLVLSLAVPVLGAPGKDGGNFGAETYGAEASAVVTKLSGNQNRLDITVGIWIVEIETILVEQEVEVPDENAEEEDAVIIVTIEVEVEIEVDVYLILAQADFMIRNNSAGFYNVGGFTVYVSTYGNEKIDLCYITEAVCLVHNWVEITVDPTCTLEGYNTFICAKDCGTVYGFWWDYTTPTGHPEWTFGDVWVAATCEEDGEGYKECAECGWGTTHVYPSFGHDLTPILNTDIGLYEMVCQRDCGEALPFLGNSGALANNIFMPAWEGPGVDKKMYAGSAFTTYVPASLSLPSQGLLQSGDNVQATRLYYPTGVNKDVELPMIVFFHGYEVLGFNANRADWLCRHLAMQGFLVVFASHQAGTGSGSFDGYPRNGANIINYTVEWLDTNTNAAIPKLAYSDDQPLYGLMGYSMGAITAMNVASSWELGRNFGGTTNANRTTMPPTHKPLFVYALELSNGGGTSQQMNTGGWGGFWSNLDDDIYVVMSTGSALSNNDKDHALRWWNAIAGHPVGNKVFIGWNSDPKTANVPAAMRIVAAHAWPANWPSTGNTIVDTSMNALHYDTIRSVTSLANQFFFGTADFDNYLADDGFIGIWWDGAEITRATLSYEVLPSREDYWR